jgi:hypothetical protein
MMSEKGGVLAGKEIVEVMDTRKWGGGISVAAVGRHCVAVQSTIIFIRKKQR